MFRLGAASGKLRSILCLGAHCDDIEIGCGGSILRLVNENPDVHVTWIVFSSDVVRAAEAEASAAIFLKGAGGKTVRIETFRNSFFPYIGADIKEYMESVRKSVDPDIIFTHCRGDLHQDHALISELTWNAFRDHFILEYEIAKYDADLRSPNLFVSLSDDDCRRKIDLIIDTFASQRKRGWFTADTFWATLRLRGIESNSGSGYAEGFYARKCVL